MFADDTDEWAHDSEIKPGLLAQEVDTAQDLIPDGIRDRDRLVHDFLSAPDTKQKTVLAKPFTQETQPENTTLLTHQQQDWLELGEQMDPGTRAMLSRRTPETLQLLKWQGGLGKNRALPLVLSVPAARMTFTVNVAAFTTVGEFRVFVLPSEAAEIQMEMGAPLTFQYEGKTSAAVFVSCYKLDGFPYKFLQLGVDTVPDKE